MSSSRNVAAKSALSLRALGRMAIEFAAVSCVYVAVTENIVGVGDIKGASMQPTLNPPPAHPDESPTRDYVLIDKLSLRMRDVQRGEVVMVRSPLERNRWLVKRVLAVPGDLVKPVNNPNRYFRIPKGHCWIEGDNVVNSQDSNDYGPVSMSLVEGVVKRIVWPPSRIGPIPEHQIQEGRVSIPDTPAESFGES
ncbi:mitochondrial integral membrane protein (IMP) complex Imp2 (core peptidase) [Andalucia godoyi]|uniref:Mitochondrial inner membrane protease subunit 2 n=1 Tax=Andalucia godoyi TaxID=505711 RepID=A0A8K0AGG2_ANDGO|nr:mitochondrial integral membrane protein (IMP) complex Imp2 (core peptidase) [Andalucia godoyi]|eukprot:ANDGO_00003.mRNA.1 mitochondrial integral membrane protein (IMP) complex Imp2 (core peptidase)